MVYLRNNRQKQYNRKASTTPNKTRGKTPKKRSISKTPPKISTTPNKKKKPSATKSPKQDLKLSPSKEVIFLSQFSSFKVGDGTDFNFERNFPRDEEEEKKKEEELEQNKKIEEEQEEQNREEEFDIEAREEKEEVELIEHFIEKKNKETASLDWKKIRKSKLFILYSKNYQRLASRLKQILDILYNRSGGDQDESLVESSSCDHEDVFVVQIREPNVKSKKTVISTCEKHHVSNNNADLLGTLDFLYSQIVLKCFIPESKKIPGRLND